jgi:hypothetical protein
VQFANSDPRMIAFFCSWLRAFFEVDEARYCCSRTHREIMGLVHALLSSPALDPG